MSALKEINKRARMLMSICVFENLNKESKTTSFTRAQLFSCIPNDSDQIVLGELKKTKWQIEMLDLATTSGILEKGRSIKGEDVYCIANEKLLNTLLNDWNDGSMILMSALVFPSLSSIPFDSALKQKAGIETEEEIVPENEADSQSFIEITTALHDIISTQKEYSAHFGELEKKAGGANKRIENLEKSVTELSSVVTKFISAIQGTINNQIKTQEYSLNTLQKQIASLSEQIVTLNNSVSSYNSKAMLMARLDTHLSEAETLKELMLANIGDDNDSPRGTKATVHKRTP